MKLTDITLTRFASNIQKGDKVKTKLDNEIYNVAYIDEVKCIAIIVSHTYGTSETIDLSHTNYLKIKE